MRRLARGTFEPGTHVAIWDRRDGGGEPVARGVYLVRLSSDRTHETQKVVLAHD